jgi:hypothetical protein
MVGSFYWSNKTTWPRCSPEFVFLAGAFNEVGEAMFPGEWTGEEWKALPSPFQSPPNPLVRPMAAELVRRRLEAMPLLPAPRPSSGGLFGNVSRFPSRNLGEPHSAHVLAWAEHQAATEFKRCQDEYLAVTGRRNAVANWLADAGISEEVTTHVLPDGQRGDPVKVKGSQVWGGAGPVWQMVVSRCCLPMAGDNGGVFSCWLFLSRDSLNRALRAFSDQGEQEEAATAGGAVSTAGGISECADWLRSEFEKPETASTRRDEFKAVALERFSGRLTGRGFRTAWERVAPDFPARSKAGRKAGGNRAA